MSCSSYVSGSTAEIPMKPFEECTTREVLPSFACELFEVHILLLDSRVFMGTSRARSPRPEARCQNTRTQHSCSMASCACSTSIALHTQRCPIPGAFSEQGALGSLQPGSKYVHAPGPGTHVHLRSHSIGNVDLET